MVRDQHFYLDEKKQKIELTDEGQQLVRYSNPPIGPHSHAMDKLHEHVERALQAHYRFRRDQHYMIEDGKVVIIDESTGRRMPDRHWREGLHQAVEAKEGVPITLASDHAAQITFQSYFRLYKKLAGMTGTAAQNWLGAAPRLQAVGGVRADQPAVHPRSAGRTASSRPRTPSSTPSPRKSSACRSWAGRC